MDNKKQDNKNNEPKRTNATPNSAGPGSIGSPDASNTTVRKGPNLFHILLVFFLITFLINYFATQYSANKTMQIEYSQFLQLVESGNVEKALLSDDEVQIMLTESADMATVEQVVYPNGREEKDRALAVDDRFVAVRVEDPDLVERFSEYGVAFSKVYTQTNSSPFFRFVLLWIVPTLIMYLIYYFVFRRMGQKMSEAGGGFSNMFGAGKSKAKEYNIEKQTGVNFNDVAGQDEAKDSLEEMVDYLHNPANYQEIGAKQPKGALLVGPPGTGKTLLAKAVAGEANVPFYSISGSEFVEMFVGMGASRVRDLFQQANKNAPCIIFIDEIDAIGKSRDNQLGSNDEREQTLNQLLAEMDGFDSSKGIIVLAATNRPEVLDKALLRPGRFDRRIIVEKPDLPGREAILKVHADKVKLGPDVDLHEIALATSGATGADLANMVNEGALLAVKEGRRAVIQQDLMESVEVVIAGKEKRDRVMNPKEREMVAYHEVGHALVSALQSHSQPVQKITIVPRTMGSLGYTMNMPEEERYLMTKEELLAQITTLLGGRAAEILRFDSTTTGAANDIARATKLARGMVTQYGMSEKFGPMGLESVQSQYLDGRAVSNCSAQSEAMVDEEVRAILNSCQQKAVALLQENEGALERIAQYLLQKENVSGAQFMELLQTEDDAEQQQ